MRALYGPDVTEEILTNCGLEVVFAPKELRVAQELSDRLGFYTCAGRSLSQPRGLAAGRRTLTVSDQRRALMLPQELMQLSDRELIVLKAGLPPVRGRKIRYYRERVFLRRLRPPPAVPVAHPIAAPASDPPRPPRLPSKPSRRPIRSSTPSFAPSPTKAARLPPPGPLRLRYRPGWIGP